MKKILNFSLVLLAGLTVALSCAKQENDLNNQTLPHGREIVNPGRPITVTATLPEATTKVTYETSYDMNDKLNGMTRKWENTDLLRVYNHADHNEYVDLDLETGDGTVTATFKGNIDFTASSYDVEVVSKGVADYLNQAQACDGDTGHLEFVAARTDVADLTNIALTESSGVLAIVAKLPTGAADEIESVELEAIDGSNVFGTGSKLTVAIGKGDVNSDNILDIFANVGAGWTIPKDKEFFLRFNAPSSATHTVYTRYYKASAETPLVSGKVAQLKLNCVHTDQYAGKADAGSSTAPYLIADKYQFANMGDLMANGATKYFKVIDNIDMGDMAMGHMLNNNGDDGYPQLVNIDGNNKTISNLGGTMFYVFKGSIKNLTFDAPAISGGSQKGGFAQYIQGTNNFITNVDIKNVSVFAASSGNCGGLIGRINSGTSGQTTATIKDCDITNVPVNSSGKAGGLIGSVEAKVIIENCTVSGNKVYNSNHYTGGLVGYAPSEIIVKKCRVDMEVEGKGKYRVGGLIGWAVLGGIEQSYAMGNVSSNGYCGGLVGTVNNADGESFAITESCYTTGTITTTGNQAGGIVGSKEGAGDLSITNCYVSGDIIASGPQRYGGILANAYAGTSTLENCYFAGTLQTNACLGGIVGWVESDGLSVTRCMSFAKKIFASQNVTSADRYCSGIIIGYANKNNSPKMIVDQCYRPAGIDFLDYPGVSSTNVVEDHDFITGTPAAIPQRHGLQYGYYHHGKETDSATLSALVQRTDIGGAWSATIWDFAQSYPRLKWMLE